jgi:hypothetical protein
MEKKITSVEVTTLTRQISPVVVEARELVVADSEGMRRATELLSRLNKFNDSVTEEKEKVTKPLNEALKAERGRWKPVEDVCAEAVSIVRGKMSEYQTAEVKRAREEEAAIAARVGEGKGKLKVETAIRKMDAVEKAEDKVNTESGMVKFREDKVLLVTDMSIVPFEYFVLDERKLLADLKAGVKVAGAELEIKMVPINFR